MTESQKGLVSIVAVYAILVCALSLSSYLYARNEAIGGMMLGLTGTIVGILFPYHLYRTGTVSFRFIPERAQAWRVTAVSLAFSAFYLFIFPSGFLGSKTTLHFLATPPSFSEGVATFVFLLISAISYALIFWGGLPFTIKKASNRVVAIVVTSLLFSVYHVSQPSFTPLTWQFLAEMFVGALLLTTFTFSVGCVLPTLIVAQIEQFFYFAALQDNPFAEPVQAFSGLVLVFLLLGVYSLIVPRREKAKSKQGASNNRRGEMENA